ncbi:hypothetical protein V5799_026424 [Amblyomma americanum]|uniref:Uncharacterized protein n=1 Tax=Amblyomma americanum TaxID=6943 RepID=A0AAQ4DIM0_AMBAM
MQYILNLLLDTCTTTCVFVLVLTFLPDIEPETSRNSAASLAADHFGFLIRRRRGDCLCYSIIHCQVCGFLGVSTLDAAAHGDAFGSRGIITKCRHHRDFHGVSNGIHHSGQHHHNHPDWPFRVSPVLLACTSWSSSCCKH